MKNATIKRMVFRTTNTKSRWLSLGVGMGLFLLLGTSAHAQDVAGTGSTITDYNFVVYLFSLLQTVVSAGGFIALHIAEYFLRPEFLSGSLTSDGRVYQIWLLARDIVNILFAVMLIGVAFYTIIMGSSAKVKEYIVYFILGVVLVNLSWFFPRVIIDISHVLTATVYQLPGALPDNKDPTLCYDGKPCTMIGDVTLWPTEDESIDCMAENPDRANPTECDCIPISENEDILCYHIEPFNAKTARGAHSMLNGLAVNYGRMTSIGKVQRTQAEPTPTGGATGPRLDTRFFVNVLFSLVFSIALIFPIIALAAALMIRIGILIFCIALMPFTFLGFVINRGKLGTNIFGIEFDVWNEFITAAFVPFFVACAFTLGFVFLNGILIVPFPATGGGTPIKMNYFVAGITNWQSLLAVCLTMMIMWGGVFASFAKSKMIGGVTNKIKGFGEQLGGIALKAPLMIPLPIPGGKAMSLGSILRLPEQINAKMETSFRTGKTLGELNKEGGGVSNNELQSASESLKGDTSGSYTKLTAALDALKKSTTKDQRESAISDIKSALDKAGIKGAGAMNEDGLKRTIEELRTKSGKEMDTSGFRAGAGASVTVEREGDSIVVNVDGSKKNPITKDLQDNLTKDAAEAHGILEIVGVGGNAKAAQKIYEELGKKATETGNTEVAGKAGKIAAALNALPEGSSSDDVKTAIEKSLT